jgi:hypothetical protein
MIDKWIYKFFGALDKFVLFVDNIVKLMNGINMNYYFTGILILGFLFLAFCGGPNRKSFSRFRGIKRQS